MTVFRALSPVVARVVSRGRVRDVPRAAVGSAAGRRLVAVVGGGAVFVVAGNTPAGVIAGVVAGMLLARYLARLPSRTEREEHARLRADLPAAADLLAACLLAGGRPVEAAAAAARAVGGPLEARVAPVVAAIRLGGDPVRSWLTLAEDPALKPLGGALSRAAAGGVAPAALLLRVADGHRAALRREATAAARRAGARVAVPLGLCFLPAFVLIGVVPVVVGLSSALLQPPGAGDGGHGPVVRFESKEVS